MRGEAPLIDLKSFCACRNCLIRRLTSCTSVPDPAAMRRRRDALSSSGSRLSAIVIEQMIASDTFRPCSKSAGISLQRRLTRASRQHFCDLAQRAHLPHLAHLGKPVLEIE